MASIGSACFGGMPVAAAIVRSAAAVDAGATSRMAPLVQSLVLALVVVSFAPLVGHIPLVALASILLVVGWRLVDWRFMAYMWRSARIEVAVPVATAAGILLTDFVIGVLIVWRSDTDGVCVLRLQGPLFFGSQAELDRLLEEVNDDGPVVVDVAAVPTLDSSGASALVRAIERIARRGNEVGSPRCRTKRVRCSRRRWPPQVIAFGSKRPCKSRSNRSDPLALAQPEQWIRRAGAATVAGGTSSPRPHSIGLERQQEEDQMDTASIPERSIGSALSQPERAQSGQAFDRVRAAELHASAHVLAVLLILAASVLPATRSPTRRGACPGSCVSSSPSSCSSARDGSIAPR